MTSVPPLILTLNAGRGVAVATVVLSFLFMMLVVGGMAVGVMFGRKPIAGSCGGMKALGMNMECEICGGDPNRCERPDTPVEAGTLAHDAVKPKGSRTL
jgi:hypothetical protein